MNCFLKIYLPISMIFAVNAIYFCMKHALIVLFKQSTLTSFIFLGTNLMFIKYMD